MEIKEVISTLLDISKKVAEFNDEVAQLNMTILSL